MIENVVVIPLPGSNIEAVNYWLLRNGIKPSNLLPKENISFADMIVLPGVGSFDLAIKYLHDEGLSHPLRQTWKAGKPILGICLGMQLFFENSEEGDLQGLSFMNGSVRKIPKTPLAVPNVGWRRITNFKGQEESFYFMHSFAVPACDGVYEMGCQRILDHNGTWLAMFQAVNLWGFQFHPEKSYDAGDRLLRDIIGAY